MVALNASSLAQRFGYFKNSIKAELLVEDGEDYRIRLLEPLTFVAASGYVTSTVPEGTVVDGASIPAWAWPLIGAPLTGDFRRAAVIHDWELRRRRFNSRQVHYLFYLAMRADGVGWFRAKAMYLAVRWFGPHFDATP